MKLCALCCFILSSCLHSLSIERRSCRRLESLENQTEQVARGVAEIQEVSGARAEAVKGRLSGLEKSLREVQRGVQLIRDKQVSLVQAAT